MAYEDFKDLPWLTAFHKILRDKAFNIDKNPKYGGYQCGLASMVYKFFDKKSALLVQSETLATWDKSTSCGAAKTKNISNQELAEELLKPILRRFRKWKLYSSFIDNIWDADLADMRLLSNKGIFFLLCAIDIFGKYAWVKKVKNGITITNVFQKKLRLI